MTSPAPNGPTATHFARQLRKVARDFTEIGEAWVKGGDEADLDRRQSDAQVRGGRLIAAAHDGGYAFNVRVAEVAAAYGCPRPDDDYMTDKAAEQLFLDVMEKLYAMGDDHFPPSSLLSDVDPVPENEIKQHRRVELDHLSTGCDLMVDWLDLWPNVHGLRVQGRRLYINGRAWEDLTAVAAEVLTRVIEAGGDPVPKGVDKVRDLKLPDQIWQYIDSVPGRGGGLRLRVPTIS